MPTVLDRIVANKREEIAFAKTRRDLQSLKEGALHGPDVRDFLQALRGHDYVRLIAEVKRASPSKGVIRPVFDHVEIALAYEAGGAAATPNRLVFTFLTSVATRSDMLAPTEIQ